MATKKKPTHEIRLGAIRASIWTNVNQDGSRWFTVTLSRLFKDEQDRWQSTQQYKLQHLPQVARVVAAAHAWMEERTVTAEASTLIDEVMSDAARGTKEPGRSV